MGNRAVIVFEEKGELSPAVYVQWNGGPESVYAFLAELERRNVRRDIQCAAPRLCQVIGDYFDFGTRCTDGNTIDSLSLYMWNAPKKFSDRSAAKLVSPAEYDNGLYVVCFKEGQKDTDTVVRRFVRKGVELTEEEVKAEHETAIATTQYAGILKSFINHDHGRVYRLPVREEVTA